MRPRCASVLAGVASILLALAAADAQTLTPAEVAAHVNDALAGPPDEVESRITAILSAAPEDEAGRVAENILLSAQEAPLAARTAVGRAVARYARVLADAGQGAAARAIVAAMENAAARGDRAALEAHHANARPTLPVPSGPVGSGINTQTVSTAE